MATGETVPPEPLASHQASPHRRARAALLSSLLAILALALLALPALAQADITWSAPSPADSLAPFGSGDVSRGASCPTDSFCAVVDESGEVSTTTDPSGGVSSWTAADIDTTASLDGISCPSSSVCVAVDTAGDVLYSSDPTGGPSAWSSEAIDPGKALSAISCPSTSLCVAVDGEGDALVSTDPASPSSWSSEDIDSGNALSAISCPSTSLCVATDQSGNVLDSTSPATGSWSSPSALTDVDVTGVSCSSTDSCVAVDDSGDVFDTATPTSGASAWSESSDIDLGNPLNAVSCAHEGLCVAVENGGNLLVSTAPTTGGSSWSVDHDVDPSGAFTAVSCPDESLCVATDDQGDISTSEVPTGGPSAWTTLSAPVSGTNSLTAVSCPAGGSFCVAVDTTGHASVSSEPLGSSSTWTATSIDPGNALEDVSCPTTSLCAASDDAGDILTSTEPQAGIWSSAAVTSVDMTGIACPQEGFCVSVDNDGDVVTSTDPTGGPSAWSLISALDSGSPLNAVSCAPGTTPSSGLCVTVENGDGLITSTAPGGGSGAWTVAHGADSNSSADIAAISCPATSLCVAVDASGDVVTSTDPTGGPSAWTTASVDTAPFTSVSCQSATDCVAVDAAGDSWSSEDPTGGPSAWSESEVEEGVGSGFVRLSARHDLLSPDFFSPMDGGSEPSLTGVSCPTSSACVTVNSAGDFSFGESTPSGEAPASTLAPVVSGKDQDGHALSASTGSWSGTGPITYSYQWHRGGASSCDDTGTDVGSDSPVYNLKAPDAGHELCVSVTATNSSGSAMATSSATSSVNGSTYVVITNHTHVRSISGTSSLVFVSPGTTEVELTEAITPSDSSTQIYKVDGHSPTSALLLPGDKLDVIATDPAEEEYEVIVGETEVTGDVESATLSLTPAAYESWSTQLSPSGDTVASYSDPIDTNDNRGSGQGWHETVTSTSYVGQSKASTSSSAGPPPEGPGDSGDQGLSSGDNLASSGTPFAFGVSGTGIDSWVTGVSLTDNEGSTDTNPTSGVGYTGDPVGDHPVTTGLEIPQASTAPAAVDLYDAAYGTGLGNFTLTPDVSVAVPANAYDGYYSSVVTLAIVSGP